MDQKQSFNLEIKYYACAFLFRIQICNFYSGNSSDHSGVFSNYPAVLEEKQNSVICDWWQREFDCLTSFTCVFLNV